MAFTKTPATWLGAGYSASSGSNTVTFTTGSASSNITVAELTDTEANTSTGDIRKIMLAFVEQFFRAYNATATADRPLKMTVTRNFVAGQDNVNTANYQFSFTLSPTVLGVADEV